MRIPISAILSFPQRTALIGDSLYVKILWLFHWFPYPISLETLILQRNDERVLKGQEMEKVDWIVR